MLNLRFASHEPFLLFLLAFQCLTSCGCEVSPTVAMPTEAAANQKLSVDKLMGWIVGPEQVTSEKIAEWKQSAGAIVLNLTTDAKREVVLNAVKAIQTAGLQLDYFIEVGRCPELADKHPQWMASLQVHPEWRREFPDVPQPTRRQVIKNYPWVTIMNQESFDAHVRRVKKILDGLPKAKRLWLNDVQGAPSACGCGHPLCRWTADYGKVKTATQLGQDAAAQFVKSVREISGVSEVIPIFVGECEAEDQNTVCCGVACFEGKCWKDFTRQLDLVAKECPQVAVGCFYKELDRDLERYKASAGWVGYTLNSFSEMPRLRDGTGLDSDRLIAVLQGWNVSDAELDSQLRQADKAAAAGSLICLSPIDQSWKPVVFDLPADVPDNTESDNRETGKVESHNHSH